MKFGSKLNKHIVTIVIIGVVTVGALGLMLLLLAGNQERNSIPVDPSRNVAKSTTQPTQIVTEKGISAEAQALFNARAESIDDQVAVAKLLEVMELQKRTGEYKVELKVEEKQKYMLINFNRPVKEANVEGFDAQMQNNAQVILALVPDAEEVHWSYTVQGEDGRRKVNTVNFNSKTKTPSVKADIKSFGSSAKKVEELLNLQRGV